MDFVFEDECSVSTTMDDVDLWGPPFVVQDDTLRKQILRGCELWFDCRTDVLEENFLNEMYCEEVWWILTKKKQVAKIDELDRDSVQLGNDMASSRTGDSHDLGGSSDSIRRLTRSRLLSVLQDKALSAVLPDADTSSAKSDLGEDENTSSISDALTIETRDSSIDTKDIDPETSLKPQETGASDPLTVEATDDAYTSSSSMLANKIVEAEEHSCSSLVTDQVVDPIKQVPENKSSSDISPENVGGSTLRPLLLETREKVREKANSRNEDGEVLKNHKQSDGMQDIVTASEPFTTESLLEMCEELDKGRETPCDEKSKRSNPEAVKIVVKDELIINLLTEASRKTASKTLLKPRSALIKKRQSKSSSSDNKGMNTSFIRNTKQKVGGEAGEINIEPIKKSTQSTPEVIRVSSFPKQDADSLLDRRSQEGGHIASDLVISTNELMNKTGKELKSIAKALKVTHYYKLKKEDLLQQLTMQLNPI